MSGYRIGPVRLANFGPFAKARYDFSAPGLTCIEGEFVGHGCDSNGSGKSYLIDAVVWCLYGRVLRDRVAKDDVVRLQFEQAGGRLEVARDANGAPMRPEEGCRVEVHLIGGPKPVKVIRYQGHPALGNRVELYVGGKPITQGRDAMTQDAIEQVIGLDYRTFVNSVAFGAGDDARSFFTATDSERKAIMERILGLEVYSDAEKVARSRHRVKQGELEAAQHKLEGVRETLAAQERILAEVVSEEELIEKRWRLRLAEVQTRCLQNYRKNMERRAQIAETALAHAETDADQVQAYYDQEARAYEKRRDEIEREIRKAERALASTDAEMRTLKSQIGKWDELAGKKCPTCRQVLAAERAGKLRAKVVGERKALRHVRAHTHAPAVEKLRRALAKLREPERPDLSALADFRAEHRARKAALANYDDRIAQAKARTREVARDHEDAQRRTAQVADEVAKTRKSIAKLTATIATLTEEVGQLGFWITGFGNGGIKSFLIESETPHINRVATRYAQRLLGPGARVQLSATKTLKSGGQREEMTVNATIPGCTVSYANASKGQKKRLDLCLLLAFRDTVSSRNAKAFEQFFADELFDGLDETGEDHVVELLRELSAKCPVVLVTHSPRLKSVGNRIITVRHEDGVSTVAESAEEMAA